MYHIPVLSDEVISFLNPQPGKTYIDCTLGGGGHAEAILKKCGGECKLIGIDTDSDAIVASKEGIKEFKNVTFIHENFVNIKKFVRKKVDGILFDLGVSSYQIDTAQRGFSIRFDGPLDMRMGRDLKISAADIVNKADFKELSDIIYKYGEDRLSRRIARKIIEYRQEDPILTTGELVNIVKRATRRFDSVISVFQALRIAVNNELENLQNALLDSIQILKKDGVIIVISYHSLEDRIVKKTFLKENLKILTKKPVRPSTEEIEMNPRSRSAKLRAAVKL